MLILKFLNLLLLLLLFCRQIMSEFQDFYGPQNELYYHKKNILNKNYNYQRAKTREIQIKYGKLRGKVVQPTDNSLQLVDVFLGVPYAEPPVGAHRFDPPKSQSPWSGTKNFFNFGPVCPQNLPNIGEEVDSRRHNYFHNVLPFLQNQNEDCLYLNIYAPHQEPSLRNGGVASGLKKYPVIMFIHGESYEWNSGNSYDGSTFAAYGNIVFITLNFRLGILGFLRPGIKQDAGSNFGLLDQGAALAWLKEHIGPFGGDPSNITLLGHGTGAVFANLLLLGSFRHFVNRAILMSGSALNPDAIGKAPMQITQQVGHALNCPRYNDDLEFQACLRNRSVQSLLNVKIDKPKYIPAFAPLVDGHLIPDTPNKVMEKHPEYLAKFDLMYGVTELEKFYNMRGVSLIHGLSNKDRDEFIRDNVKASYELEPELILDEVLQYYGDEERRPHSGTKEERNRDLALEVISDSSVVAGLLRTANIHSRVNDKSWMYVFTNLRPLKDGYDASLNQQQQTPKHQIRQSVYGDDLLYVLGKPLEDTENIYKEDDLRLSKAMMDWWSNFAYSGNPNNQRPLDLSQISIKDEYDLTPPYHTDWPEFDPELQMYFNLTTPPKPGIGYRSAEAEFWNDVIPGLLRRPKTSKQIDGKHTDDLWMQLGINNITTATIEVEYKEENNKKVVKKLNVKDIKTDDKMVENSSNMQKANSFTSTSTDRLVIGFGVVFLLINAAGLIYIHYKRHTIQFKVPTRSLLFYTAERRGHHHQENFTTNLPSTRPKQSQTSPLPQLGYCNSTSKPDIRELIKNDKAYDNSSNFGRNSTASTIDTRIKVREWIQQEIVHRCSPRFLRKTRENFQQEHREKMIKQQLDLKDYNNATAINLYSEDCNIQVRPGDHQVRKASVVVDSTPTTWTGSLQNQISKDSDRSKIKDYESTKINLSDYCEPIELQPKNDGYLKVIESMPKPKQIKELESNSSVQSNLSCNNTTPCFLTIGQSNFLNLNMTSHETSQSIDTVDARNTLASRRNSNSHEKAMKTIKRRNYPKVLPDIENRRSLPSNSPFFQDSAQHLVTFSDVSQQNKITPPSTPSRGLFGVSKSLDSVDDANDDEEDEKCSISMPVTTKLHVGPLKRKIDSLKNESSPSLPGSFSSTSEVSISNATTIPLCLVHRINKSSEQLFGERSEPRIIIAPVIENAIKPAIIVDQESQKLDVDQPVYSTLIRRPQVPERGIKIPRIIIKPSTISSNGTFPRPINKPKICGTISNLQDNETYLRLLELREKMPVPQERLMPTMIPSYRNISDVAAITKL